MRINRWTFRRWAKRMLVGISSRRSYDGTDRVVVLCYHSVHPQQWPASLSPELFDEHLGWLKTNCDVVPFSQISQRTGRTSNPRPTVAITFDDGYADNREYAFSLLKKWQLPATFFVTAGLLERDPLVLERFGSFYALGPNDVGPMDWKDLLEMLAEGMEVGAHAYSHANLAGSDPEELKRELLLSKTMIEERIGLPVTSMAYPFGLRRAHFNERVIEAVREAGYETAASVLYRGVRASDLPYSIPRFFVKRDDVKTLRLKVLGGFDVVSLWQTWTPLSLGRLLSPDYFGSGDWMKATR
jgi:peptidoglycan/xylan/chitin deacetylase (PgdA/CDA1 family)